MQLYVRPVSEVLEEQLGIAREQLDSFLAAEFPVAQCPRILASGDAATEIARVAREGGFDLIIMPTHSGIFRQMLLRSTAAKVAELQKMVGMDVPARIAVGSVKEALLEAARESDADVLMIGRSHQGGSHGRMRDLTYAMVRDSPFPVLSV
jgi:nucleotide-binding universal stress UspA family protein